MKKLSLIISILGLLLLSLLIFTQQPTQIHNKTDLANLQQNQQVIISGKVTNENSYSSYRVLKLNNNLEIICNKCPSYINKNLSILGKIQTYTGKTQVIALKIKVLD